MLCRDASLDARHARTLMLRKTYTDYLTEPSAPRSLNPSCLISTARGTSKINHPMEILRRSVAIGERRQCYYDQCFCNGIFFSSQYHPWRSPGRAPVSDPCGISGGDAHYNVQAAVGSKKGDKGSNLPPLNITTTWFKGAVEEVGFMLGANHGSLVFIGKAMCV